MNKNKRKFLRTFAKYKHIHKTYVTNNIINGKSVNVNARMLETNSERLAWIGTSLLMVGPYLLSYQIGFIINFVGIVLLTPQVYKAKQWNLVILNVASSTGYLLQILNII